MPITLSNSTIAENTANGTVVGIISGGTAPYTLADNAGGAFSIVNNGGTWELRVANTVKLDYEGTTLHQLPIQITDGVNPALSINITLTDVDPETVTGTSGDDVIEGGAGNDTLSGADGNDTIESGEGNNVLSGGAGNDSLYGGSGNDYLDGGTGGDTMIGGAGDDTFVVDSALDSVLASIGGGNSDTLIFQGTFTNSSNLYQVSLGIENIVIDEAAGAAFIEANGAANTITGNSFANFINAGTGADTIDGGLGNDTFVIYDSNAVVSGGGGTDEVQSHVSYTISNTNVENLTLLGLSNINATGNSGSNVITGNSRSNRLDGAAGSVDTLVGGNGNDTYVLYAGKADTITELTGGGIDTIEIAGDFNLGTVAEVENLINTDTVGHNLVGNALNNQITGSAGHDFIDGGLGKDTMIGGAGDDTYVVDQATEFITEDEHLTGGTDRVVAQVSYDLSLAAAEVEEIFLDVGLSNANINATGNDYDNLIVGNEGNNKLDGKLGVDTMYGGDGNDTYVVRDASTVVRELKDDGSGNINVVSAGTDLVESYVTFSLAGDAALENLTLLGSDDINATGNAGANVITGNAGANAIDGGAGADTMDGGAGDDTYTVDSTSDVVSETSTSGGQDRVNASASFTIGSNIEELWLTGTAANGTGNSSANLIVGNGEANVLDGKAGADTMWGGNGNDTYVIDNVGDVALDVLSDGTTAASGTDWATSETQDIDLSDTARFSGIENILFGGSLNLDATGTSGNNVITGNAGNNLLDAGTGVDSLAGGLGDDTYVLDSADDTVVEAADEGTDTIEVNATYSLASLANIENLTLTGTADINATGNDLDNTIIGNSGANLIDGGAGSDRMEGGAGDDTYVVDNTGDRVIEAANGGFDTVSASASFTLGAEVEGLILTGTDDINGVGNAVANRIEGNSGDNVINGGAGADTMIGNEGDDTFWVDEAGDSVDGGDDTDTVKSGAIALDLTDYTDVENATIVGTAALNLTGTAGDNVLTGGGGANRLDGNGGADTMYGGGGNDTYVVDSADDVIAEAGNGVIAGGTDTVEWTGAVGFTEYTLGDGLENLTMIGANAITGTGNALNNVIVGSSVANAIDGGAGKDTMEGGDGDDTYYVNDAGDRIVEASGEGTDLAISSAASWTMSAEVENVTLAEGTSRRDVFGNALDNVMTGNGQANWMAGYAGSDTMNGGAGNDTFVISGGADVDVVDGGDGIDWINSNALSVDLSLTARYTNVENIKLTDVNATTFNNINATGTSGANRIVGNSGNNLIDGGAGADTMQGGKGNDTYYVDNSGDKVQEYSNGGTDTVQATGSSGFTAFTLGGNVENLVLSTGMITGKGNGLANTITGNSAANVINGAAGIDTMIGGDGDDTYYIDKVNETITEASSVGAGTDTVRTYVTGYTLGSNLENLELMGLVKTGTGNSLANTITGNNAGNLIDGGANAVGGDFDTLIGGRGNDTYVVHDADDVVVEASGQGYDRVQSSVTYTLGDNIEVLELTGSASVNGTGNGLANQLIGNSGANVLNGGAGNDVLNGGAGADTLIGGAGNDIFVLGNSATVDVIQDFSVADDTIRLSKSAFSALGTVGTTLEAAAFATGTGAADAGDRIIYNSANGKVFYDADGSGAGAQVEIAQLATGLALTNADFVIGS